MKRVGSIDFTRGLVMIIMALDHTRDFMHVSSLTQSPTDLTTTTPLLFFTRWITHLCAPTFVFLSGTSAFLSFRKEGSYIKSRNFLLTRGIWLLILEFTVVNFALSFDLQFRTIIFEVIGAIGFGFIILALLLKVNARIISIIGLAIIFGHDLLQYVPLTDASLFKTIIPPLFTSTAYTITPHFTFLIAYPPIPWTGIMLTGFAAGRLFQLDGKKRKSLFLKIGLIALILFVFIRLFNFYGDPLKWSRQKNNVFSFLSFTNVSKYPPSLLFCLITLSIMFLILSFAEGITNRFTEIVTVYGKVPLFYFLIHLYIIHCLMLAMVFLQGFSWSQLIFANFNFGRPKNGSGAALWLIYLIWAGVVTLLYPLCKWYGFYKLNHREKRWLRYL